MIMKERLPTLRSRPLLLTIYLATLVWPISMSSLSNSPWIPWRSHSGLAMLISRISLRISVGKVGRPPRRRDLQRQYDLNPARCHFITVSGFKTARAFRDCWRQSIQPGKDQAVHGAERLPLGRMPSQYVKSDAEDQDLGCQRGARFGTIIPAPTRSGCKLLS